MACHKPKLVNWRGQSIALNGGELAVSVRAFAEQIGATHKELRVALERFEREGMIVHNAIPAKNDSAKNGTVQGTVGSRISICNWDKYQGSEIGNGTESGTIGAQSGHTEQERKNLKKDSRSSSLRSEDSSAEADWPVGRLREAVEIWNEELGDVLPRSLKLTSKRAAHLRVRLRDDLGSLDAWRAYCRRIRGVPFLIGDGQTGWRADFDWAINESNLTKVIEGKYDHSKANGRSAGIVRAGGAVLERMEQAAADHERHGAFADGDEIP